MGPLLLWMLAALACGLAAEAPTDSEALRPLLGCGGKETEKSQVSEACPTPYDRHGCLEGQCAEHEGRSMASPPNAPLLWLW